MKELRKHYDPRTGTSFNVNIRTGIVCALDGTYPDYAEQTRILNAVKSRLRSADRSKERDDVMRSLGLVKVRGAVSGSIYWE